MSGFYLSTLTTRWTWTKSDWGSTEASPAGPNFPFCWRVLLVFSLCLCIIVTKQNINKCKCGCANCEGYPSQYNMWCLDIRLWFDDSLDIRLWFDDSNWVTHNLNNYLHFATCQGSNSRSINWNFSLIIYQTDGARSVVMRSISSC